MQGKTRSAFRAGFLGVDSLGLVDAGADRGGERERPRGSGRALARRLLERFGAPDLDAARVAAEEEVAFAASLCNQPQDTLIAVHRSFEDGEIREAFRTLQPRGGPKPLRAFSFLDVEGEEEPDRAGRSAQPETGRAEVKDFWLACGHHLLDRDEGGGLLLTDEFLKVYLARPELAPPPEACAVEKTLHAALMADPRRAGERKPRSPRSPTRMRARTGR